MKVASNTNKDQVLRPPASDPFLDLIRKMIESGELARSGHNDLKAHIVLQVQVHSSEIPYLRGEMSQVFLGLCDLIIGGKLSRLSPEALKLYTVILTDASTNEQPRKSALIKQITGIADDETLNIAFQQLQEGGYLDAGRNLPSHRKRNKKEDEDPDEPLGS